MVNGLWQRIVAGKRLGACSIGLRLLVEFIIIVVQLLQFAVDFQQLFTSRDFAWCKKRSWKSDPVTKIPGNYVTKICFVHILGELLCLKTLFDLSLFLIRGFGSLDKNQTALKKIQFYEHFRIRLFRVVRRLTVYNWKSISDEKLKKKISDDSFQTFGIVDIFEVSRILFTYILKKIKVINLKQTPKVPPIP